MRANYDYAGKYLLEVVGRYDGSYRYAPSKRWTFFPSVSAGWRLSEESFIKDNLPFITNLKIRVLLDKVDMMPVILSNMYLLIIRLLMVMFLMVPADYGYGSSWCSD